MAIFRDSKNIKLKKTRKTERPNFSMVWNGNVRIATQSQT